VPRDQQAVYSLHILVLHVPVVVEDEDGVALTGEILMYGLELSVYLSSFIH